MLQNSHNNQMPSVINDEIYDPTTAEIDIDNLNIPVLKHDGEAILEKIKEKEKSLEDQITDSSVSSNIVELQNELTQFKTMNEELEKEQDKLKNLRIQYIQHWHMFSRWFNGSHKLENRYSYTLLNGKYYYVKNDPLTISRTGNISVSNITLLSSNESNFYIQLLPAKQKLTDSYYSRRYQGYKLTLPYQKKLIEVDLMIYLDHPLWLSELKMELQPVVNASNSIREQKDKISKYISEQQPTTTDFDEYLLDLQNLDY